MKKLLLALSLVLVLGAVSCVRVNFDDGDDSGGAGTIDPTSNVITGVISSSKFYAKGKWILKG